METSPAAADDGGDEDGALVHGCRRFGHGNARSDCVPTVRRKKRRLRRIWKKRCCRATLSPFSWPKRPSALTSPLMGGFLPGLLDDFLLDARSGSWPSNLMGGLPSTIDLAWGCRMGCWPPLDAGSSLSSPACSSSSSPAGSATRPTLHFAVVIHSSRPACCRGMEKISPALVVDPPRLPLTSPPPSTPHCRCRDGFSGQPWLPLVDRCRCFLPPVAVGEDAPLAIAVRICVDAVQICVAAVTATVGFEGDDGAPNFDAPAVHG
ncbi:hypothetical protein ACLOJK_002334 [Asimina triloba]